MADTEKSSLEASMLQKLMAKLPGFTTKCSTAQLKTVQHNSFDTPKEYWCCYVIDTEGKKHFAMYDANAEKVKTVSEEKKKSYIVKAKK
jgi:L-ascorbate metabolism protein UlaG (beta-lactamase superfamily)